MNEHHFPRFNEDFWDSFISFGWSIASYFNSYVKQAFNLIPLAFRVFFPFLSWLSLRYFQVISLELFSLTITRSDAIVAQLYRESLDVDGICIFLEPPISTFTPPKV